MTYATWKPEEIKTALKWNFTPTRQYKVTKCRNSRYWQITNDKGTSLKFFKYRLNIATQVQGVQPSNTWLDHRDKNLGNSDYAKHKIQPWDIWKEYNLNPWDADIVKRILRTKTDAGMSPKEQRILDYKKIIHNCEERIRQLKN